METCHTQDVHTIPNEIYNNNNSSSSNNDDDDDDERLKHDICTLLDQGKRLPLPVNEVVHWDDSQCKQDDWEDECQITGVDNVSLERKLSRMFSGDGDCFATIVTRGTNKVVVMKHEK